MSERSTLRSETVPRADRGVIRHTARQYGRSEQNNPLEIYGPRKGPVDVLLFAAIHGDESESTVVLSEALRRVPPGQIYNPVILACNPDGLLRGTRANARGVDLNRNWPTSNWSADPVGYNNREGSARDIALSTGQAPASEAETRALLTCIEQLQPSTVISIHSPLACIEDPKKRPLSAWIANQVGLPLVEDVGYPTPGSFGTWAAENDIHIITWELASVSLAEMIETSVTTLYQLISGNFEIK